MDTGRGRRRVCASAPFASLRVTVWSAACGCSDRSHSGVADQPSIAPADGGRAAERVHEQRAAAAGYVGGYVHALERHPEIVGGHVEVACNACTADPVLAS